MLWLRQLVIHIERWPVRLSTRDAVPDAAALAALGAVLAKAPIKDPRSQDTDLGPTISSPQQQYVWHPLIGSVTQQLGALTVADRAAVLAGWLNWLNDRKSKAENALKLAGVAADIPTKLAPARGLPTAPDGLKTHFIDPRLRLAAGRMNQDLQEPDGTDKALPALEDIAGTAASAAATAAAAAAMLQQVRNLADVYARWEAAATVAANLVSTQLARPALTAPELVARMLAFFRTEGDCTVPPEADTLDTSLQKVPLPPGRSLFWPQIGMTYYSYCATYLVDQAKYASYVIPGDVDDKLGLDIDPIVEADRAFALTLAGMDILRNKTFQREAEAVYPTSPPFVQTDQFDWWALNREKALGLDHDTAKTRVKTEYESQKGMLFFSEFGPAGMLGSTYRVAADAGWAAGYLTSMLTQAAWYLDRLSYGPTRFGPGAPTRLPEPMVYLLYHLGSEAPAMLCSATQAAYWSSTPAAKPLRDALRANGYTQQIRAAAQNLKSVRKSLAEMLNDDPYSDEEQRSLREDWPLVAPVLSQPAVLAALTDYLTTADGKEWKDFHPHRQNILGYRRMWEFLKPQVAP